MSDLRARRAACIEQAEMPYPGVPIHAGPLGALVCTPLEARLDVQMARTAEALARRIWGSR